MKRILQTLAALAALGAVGGAAVVFGGLYNVSAREGHWSITPWVLHTTFRNSVELRAPAQSEVPDLTQAGMVALGAKHFDGGCKTCHAGPGEERWAVPTAMVPHPPHIVEAVGSWAPNELHWIVDEGVKMSGMPYWPAERTDDIWPVVAFLQRVDDMAAGEYDALTLHPPAPEGAPDDLPYCAMCHGVSGLSNNPLIPRLDIQPQAYLEQTLQAYADGERESGIMHVAATRVSSEALMELAAWFAEQDVAASAETEAADPDLIATGEALATNGTRDVPACTACHGPKADQPRAASFPRLAGQSETFLAQQLRLWRSGVRGGGDTSNLMTKSAQDLTDDDIAALSAWYATQVPTKPLSAQ
ncbi:Cytochrome c4 precursor [Rhodobacteraceae bacterium THAF1]|uniref:c-type cytochrome n=1 Tax=Palleronia sp. THAF1 TaxID=2587842 RepID=UPI000F3D95C5|nr:c-type cytochrome [Palleronia sp. THAF1]QFU08170.1 Cytochrome c4 precursor [Palleronia sp. THAF1]VDC28721.1 Cytochrome c4 precursor [Rhodobacteraceae bacterium THAF1]